MLNPNQNQNAKPNKRCYDVIIIGGAIMGSSIAWFLSSNPDFDGTILIVERDTSYQYSSTALSCSGIRHQFSTAVNVKISQFASEFIQNFKQYTQTPDAPDLNLVENGYLFLANESKEHILRENQTLQASCGAATKLLTSEQINTKFPFYSLDDISLGSWNPTGEGWFDSYGMMQTLRKQAVANGVDFVNNEVIGIQHNGKTISAVELKTGDIIQSGTIVNCSGPRAALVASYAGIEIPIRARKRNIFVVSCETPISERMPLTIDPSGIFIRPENDLFITGVLPVEDPDVDYDDFNIVHNQFDEFIWPVLANRIPRFEALKVVNSWAGHYAYNTLDQNAVVGPHPQISNFIFANGFSGHGVQQAPAVGRAICEWITYNEYRALDLTELGFQRIIDNKPFLEKAIV